MRMSADEVRAARRALADAHALVIDGDAEIRIAHPLSATPTGFDVETGGRTLHGNCIWDSLAIPAMLKADARIMASCGDCQETMEVRIEDGKLIGGDVASDTRLMHAVLPAARWWEDVVFTCKTILLFRGEEHLARWCAQWRMTRGAALPLFQAWVLAQAWYGNRMDADWQPRDVESAQAILDRTGLRGSFWRLKG